MQPGKQLMERWRLPARKTSRPVSGPCDRRELTAMATRIDYFDDPAAPAANSMVPSVNVVVTDDAGRILLIRHTDNGNWAVPGGAIDLGESMIDSAIRET